MAQVRLPVGVEYRIARTVSALPARLQRALFGPPPALDGQRLATDVHALIELNRIGCGKTYPEEPSPAAARAARRHRAAATGPRPPLPMARVEDFALPSPCGLLAARRYVPRRSGVGPAPLLLFFHGGGWVIGDLQTHDGVCRFLAAESGVDVLAIDYRLAPEHPFPAAVEDAWAALSWTLANAAALGVDSSRVAVGGDSAGGNLAAVLCLLAREASLPLAMQLLIYPIADAIGGQRSRQIFAEGFTLTTADMEWFQDHYLPPGVDRADPRVSVLRAADVSGLPPAYVATAGFDPLRDEAEAYAARMREAGVAVALRRHSELSHTFANLTALSPTARAAMLEATGALRMGLA